MGSHQFKELVAAQVGRRLWGRTGSVRVNIRPLVHARRLVHVRGGRSRGQKGMLLKFVILSSDNYATGKSRTRGCAL